MKNVVILGAGMVTAPMVDYLLDTAEARITLADMVPEKAEEITRGRQHARTAKLDVTRRTELTELISGADLVVSLVPYTFHPLVAELCIAAGKPMVTASYVSDAMAKLDSAAQKAGILILNEVGLDPGIDHMSAMRIIHAVQAKGGRIVSFESYCGGLPAPEANTNPLGYKFSWSPRGVVLAGKNTARYRKNGAEVLVPAEELFSHTWLVDIPGTGTLEAYPNRDSLPYSRIYGLADADTLYRGTLRYPGWCETWKLIAETGMLSLEERDDLHGISYSSLTANITGIEDGGNLKRKLAEKFGRDEDATAVKNLEWLGFFSDDPVPAGQRTVLDVLSETLLRKMQYEPAERDMVVLHHEFTASYPDRSREKITSTLTACGEPGGASAMARTVSLPAAISARLMLEGKIDLTGVRIPVMPELYDPVLDELEALGITFTETAAAE